MTYLVTIRATRLNRQQSIEAVYSATIITLIEKRSSENFLFLIYILSYRRELPLINNQLKRRQSLFRWINLRPM